MREKKGQGLPFNALIICKKEKKNCKDQQLPNKTCAIPQRCQNKSSAFLWMILLNLMLLQQMKVRPAEGFKRLGNASNVLDLSDINTSDLKPDT